MSLERTDYNFQADCFAKMTDYAVECGTDYLAVQDAPQIISQIQPLENILDLGCGTGLATRFLKKNFPTAFVMGADLNAKMLEQAKKADATGVYIHIPKFDNTIVYPFLSNTFDVIVSSFVLHENRTKDQLDDFLKNIARMLRPGGLFLAWDPCENLFHGKWKNIEKISPLHSSINNGEQYSVKILPVGAEVTGTFWSPETIIDVAKLHHFDPVKIHYPTVAEDPRMQWLDETKMAPYYVIEAKKAVVKMTI